MATAQRCVRPLSSATIRATGVPRSVMTMPCPSRAASIHRPTERRRHQSALRRLDRVRAELDGLRTADARREEELESSVLFDGLHTTDARRSNPSAEREVCGSEDTRASMPAPTPSLGTFNTTTNSPCRERRSTGSSAAPACVVAEPKKKPKAAYIRFAAEQPNETWQADFTHHRLADGHRHRNPHLARRPLPLRPVTSPPTDPVTGPIVRRHLPRHDRRTRHHRSRR